MKDGSELAVVTGTSYQVTGLAADTTYLFRVKARDQDDNTSNGVSINVSTLAIPDSTPPNDVTGLSSSNLTSSSVTVSWTASSSTDINDYIIYLDGTEIGITDVSSFEVSGLVQSTSYTVLVKSRDNSGNISTGASLNLTTLADTTPPAE